MANPRTKEDGLRFTSLADISPAGIFLTDKTGNCTYVNRAWTKLSGLNEIQASGRGWTKAIHPEDAALVEREWQKAIENQMVFELDFRFQKPCGGVSWISALSSRYTDANGEPIGYVGLCFDISERTKLQTEIDTANFQFRKAESIAKIGTWRLELSDSKLFWSDEIFAIHEIENTVVPPLEKVLSHYPGTAKTQLLEAIEGTIESGRSFDLETNFRSANNVLKRVRNIVEPQFEGNKLVSIIGVCQDVTEQFQLEKKLRKAALYDDLTGIANRKKFADVMLKLTEPASASESDGIDIALILIDLDDFKMVNDELGHPTGDGLLVQVASRLASIPDTELVARLGGDEFAILKTIPAGRHGCLATIHEIQNCFERPFVINENKIRCSASIGWSTGAIGRVCQEGLSREADIALYSSKDKKPKIPVQYDQAIGEKYERRIKLSSDLRTALSQDQMTVLFQPMLDVASNEIVSFEALLRWHHPEYGDVSPMEFISIAEDTGFIGKLGDWVLLEACRQVSDWPEQIHVSVNVSATQLREPDFVSKVLRALAKYQIAADRLEIEITESVFIEKTEQARTVLERLRELGVKIALDDFGTGFSSLSYLCAISFDKVKIDRSFVAQIEKFKGSAPIISAVTGLGEALDFITVAEGVESLEQLQFLKDKGCDQIQGYLISKPMSGAAVLDMVGLTHARTASKGG